MTQTGSTHSQQLVRQSLQYEQSRKSIKRLLKFDQSFDCSMLHDDDDNSRFSQTSEEEAFGNVVPSKLEEPEFENENSDSPTGKLLKKINEINKKSTIDVQISSNQYDGQNEKSILRNESLNMNISNSESFILRLFDSNSIENGNEEIQQSDETCLASKFSLQKRKDNINQQKKVFILNNQGQNSNQQARQIENMNNNQSQVRRQRQRLANEVFQYVDQINQAESHKSRKKLHNYYPHQLYLSQRQSKFSNFNDDCASLTILKRKTCYRLKRIRKQFEQTIQIINRRKQQNSIFLKAKHYQYLWKLGKSVTCWKSLSQPQQLLQLYICQAKIEGSQILQYLPPNLETSLNHSLLITQIEECSKVSQITKEQIKMELFKRQFLNQILIDFKAIVYDLVLNFNRNQEQKEKVQKSTCQKEVKIQTEQIFVDIDNPIQQQNLKDQNNGRHITKREEIKHPKNRLQRDSIRKSNLNQLSFLLKRQIS